MYTERRQVSGFSLPAFPLAIEPMAVLGPYICFFNAPETLRMLSRMISASRRRV